MSLKLPNDKIVYNLPEQVGVNTENIKYLAEEYKNIDSIPSQYAELKADYDDNIKAYFDNTMKPTFTSWTNTFNGWTIQLGTYLASMSSAAVGAIAGQNIAPANITSSGDISGTNISASNNISASGKIAAPAIEQTAPQYSATFNFTGASGLTASSIYNRFERIGNILYLIANIQLTNNTGSTISFDAKKQIAYSATTITDSATRAAIYDINGENLQAAASVDLTLITISDATISTTKTRSSSMFLGKLLFMHTSGGPGTVQCDFYTYEALSVNDGSSIYCFARIPLTLL